jgi:benzoylformate decarboxylase
MLKMTVAQAVLDILKREGVNHIFGNPGTTEVPLLDALVEQRGLEYILVLHESAAVAMADGYTRSGINIGVVNVHTAVGTANCIASLFNAHVGRSPLLILIANKDSRILGRESFCEAPDLLGMTRQFTKWSWQSIHPSNAIGDLVRAIKIATTPPKGPVFFAIPENFLVEEFKTELPASQTLKLPIRIKGDPIEISRAADLLVEAKRPLFVAGNEIAKHDAVPLAIQLAERLSLPVMTEVRQSLEFLNFPHTHPYFRNVYDASSSYVKEADVILGIGCRMFVDPAYSGIPKIPKDAKIIHVHSDPHEIGRLYPTEVGIVSDAYSALTDILSAIPPRGTSKTKERGELLEKEKANEAALLKSKLEEEWNKTPISLSRFVEEMNQILDPETIIIDEAVISSPTLQNYYNFNKPGTYFRTAAGALGWGIPGSLGMKLARPSKPVVAVVGDGSALFSIQALWTAARYNIATITLVWNNFEYKAVKDELKRFGGNSVRDNLFVGADIKNPTIDFVSLAEGFGVEGKRIKEPHEIRSALEYGVGQNSPFLLDVIIQP